MKDVKELKQSVMTSMRSCWGENAAVFFISAGGGTAVLLALMLISDLLRSADPEAVSGRRIDLGSGAMLAAAAALVMLWLLAVPFEYGVKWYRLQQVRGRSVHARSIFTCYGSWRRLGQIFRFTAALYARRLYFLLPAAALITAGIFAAIRMDTALAAVIIFLSAGCVICGAVLINRKYALAPYLFVLDPKAPPKELIDKSVRLTRGREHYLSDALFAAAAWFPACILVFPAVFVVPYSQTLYTAAVNELISAGTEVPNKTAKGTAP